MRIGSSWCDALRYRQAIALPGSLDASVLSRAKFALNAAKSSGIADGDGDGIDGCAIATLSLRVNGEETELRAGAGALPKL